MATISDPYGVALAASTKLSTKKKVLSSAKGVLASAGVAIAFVGALHCYDNVVKGFCVSQHGKCRDPRCWRRAGMT